MRVGSMDWTVVHSTLSKAQTQLGEEPGQQNVVLKPQSVVGTGFQVMDVATGPGCHPGTHASLPHSSRLGEVSN